MARCKGRCNTGLSCKKNVLGEYCVIHNPEIICNLCKKFCSITKRFVSKECGHIFCKKCVSQEFYDTQWFDDFSTEHHILCPECDLKMNDNDFQKITSYICDTFLLQRKIVYKTWLCAEQYLGLKDFIEIGREYAPLEIEKIKLAWNLGDRLSRRQLPFNNTVVDIVYFQKFTGKFNSQQMGVYGADHTYYSFWYPCEVKINDNIKKELMEKIFHPDNLKRTGYFEDN